MMTKSRIIALCRNALKTEGNLWTLVEIFNIVTQEQFPSFVGPFYFFANVDHAKGQKYTLRIIGPDNNEVGNVGITAEDDDAPNINISVPITSFEAKVSGDYTFQLEVDGEAQASTVLHVLRK